MEPARNAVVRSIARAVARPCARPGCPAPASATLSFRYASREAWLAELRLEATPETYDLCRNHADRTRPPHGWQLVDRRPADERRHHSEGFDDERTVAVLAAALRPADEPPPALGGEAAVEPDGAVLDGGVEQPEPGSQVDDDDLVAVLSDLVRELDTRVEVEGSDDDLSEPAEWVLAAEVPEEEPDAVALLTEAVAAFQDVDPARAQDRLPLDHPTAARDW